MEQFFTLLSDYSWDAILILLGSLALGWTILIHYLSQNDWQTFWHIAAVWVIAGLYIGAVSAVERLSANGPRPYVWTASVAAVAIWSFVWPFVVAGHLGGTAYARGKYYLKRTWSKVSAWVTDVWGKIGDWVFSFNINLPRL